MLLKRTFDATLLNEVINSPDVRPWVAGEGIIDVSTIVGSPANFALVMDGGGFILIRHEPGIYEVHSQFLPSARQHSVRAMREGFEYMFTQTDCHTVLTQVPDNNRHAQAFAKLARFQTMFRREHAERGPTAYMELTASAWAQSNPSLEVDGERFHEQLATAKQARGSELPEHPHDAAHERAVGAAVRMIRAGNATKGVSLYNRWARLAGYAPISIVSTAPLVIDVVDAVVSLSPNGLEVLLCR